MRVYLVTLEDFRRKTALMDPGEKGYYWETKNDIIVEFPKRSVILRAVVPKTRFRNNVEIGLFLGGLTKVEGVVE